MFEFDPLSHSLSQHIFSPFCDFVAIKAAKNLKLCCDNEHYRNKIRCDNRGAPSLDIRLNNPVSDGNVNDFNESLAEIEISQNDLGHSLDSLREEISSLSANASCEEISKFNVIEDGYYMMRFQI